jgi:hypothetical protein
MSQAITATVSGPVTGGSHGWAFGVPSVESCGYVAQEYFLEGTASRFAPTTGTDLGWDGRWHALPAATAPFKTRLVVLRPIDAARFNGTVVLLWNNVSGGFDAIGVGDTGELLLGGYAVVAVTAQRVGVHGLGDYPLGLLAWDHERYGSLSIPSDDYSFDIFTQAARVVRTNGAAEPVDPLGGLAVRHVIGYGGSQSAARLATYANAVQPISNAIDGFLLTFYFGWGSPLEVGDEVLNVTDPATIGRFLDGGVHLLRDDLDQPIMIVNSELEAIACHRVRQPDTDRFRWWEIAGTAHSSPQVMRELSKLTERDLGVEIPVSDDVNQISPRPVIDAAMHHLRSRVEGGSPPPAQPRIAFGGDPPRVVRDEDGIARGGIRLPQAEVPLACNSSIPRDEEAHSLLVGSCRPFSPDDVRARYGDLSGYLARFEQAALDAVSAGVILERDVEALLAQARDDFPQGG